MLVHKVSTWCTVLATDLIKVPFDQISTRSALLRIPDGTCIVGLLIIMGVFNLLLEPKLLKDFEVNETGMELIPT